MTRETGSPPPSLPARLLAWSLAPREREYVLGDLIEEYELRAARDRRAAVIWVWRQALASLSPNLRRRLARRESMAPTKRGVSMHGMLADVRFSARLLRHHPGLTIVALISLVVGLGLNVVLFTVANAVLYRPLPVRDPHSLVLLGMQRPTNVAQNFPYAAYEAFAQHTDVFETLTAYASRSAALRFGGETVSADGELVSGTLFGGLGVPLANGRGLTPHDDRAAAPPAAVVSERLWRQRFAGAPLSGQTLTVNGTPFAIVGVADERFRGMFTGAEADFWLPLAHSSVVTGRDLLRQPTTSWLWLLGRLRPGVTVEAARDALDPTLAAAFKAARAVREPLVASSGLRGSDMLTPRLERPLRLLMLAAGFVLLVACVNVANLQLARNASRRRELAVRVALGAGRGRLVRLLLIDAAMLVVPASSLAVALAWAGREPALGLITRFGQPVKLAAPIDLRVFLFATAAAAGAALFVGMLSAWQAARPPAEALAEGGRSETGSQRTQRALIVVQFALSMTLLVGAALLVRSVSNLRNTDLGFATNVVMIEAAPGDAQITGAAATQYVRQAIARAATVPGVESAAAAHVLPLDFGGSRTTVRIPGYTPQQDEDMELNYLRVSPGYFDTMRIPLLRGRTFNAGDRPGAPVRIVVNETMARRYWPEGDAVGRPLGIASNGAPDGEVVGIVADVHYRMVREEPRPSFYLAFDQSPFFQAVIHARTAGDPAALVETLRRAVTEVNPAVPVSRAVSLREQKLRNIADDRMAEAIGVVLGASALVLAAVGLYGTMAFTVRRRTREIGVRLALGASVRDVRRLVLRQGLALVAFGAALGAIASLIVGRLLVNQLYGVSPTDPTSIGAAFAVLTGIALLATWLPARRATKIEPVVALRE